MEKLISSEISMNSTAQTDHNLSHSFETSLKNVNIAKKVSFPDTAHNNNNTNDYEDDFNEDQAENENDQSFASVTTTTSSIVDNKVIKRKVVRSVYF